MPDEIIAAGLTVTCLVWWAAARGQPNWVRLAAAACLLAMLTTFVFRSVGAPVRPSFSGSAGWVFGQKAIVAFWWVLAARLMAEIVRYGFARSPLGRAGRLVPDLLAGLLYLAAALGIIGSVFGLPVGALVATSGVIAIVLGLALQSSLSDVFSGIAVGIEQPYAVGDRILIDGQSEGTVVQINWRSVRIQTDGDDVATIPNSIAAKSRIVNRSVPSKRRRDTVHVPCLSSVPAEQVIALIGNALLLCPTVLAKPAAAIAIAELGKHFNTYQVSFSAIDGDALGGARNTLLLQIVRQFRAAGIVGAEIRRSDPNEEKRDGIAIPLFSSLTAEQLASLSAATLRRSLLPEAVIFSEGSSDNSLFIMVSGVFEVTRTVAGVSTIVGRIGPGDYVGEIGLLTGAPHGAEVKALTNSVVLELRSANLRPLLAAQPDLLHAFEAAAKLGQTYLERTVAASVGVGASSAPDLISRIRSYFAVH
ncbi:MAG: mechanosensitive ion channel family protein [Janthinobacterium lividum]